MQRTSRRLFVSRVLGVAASAIAGPRIASAGGARSGDWCLPLSKAGRENVFDFSLYLLDGNDAVFTLSDERGHAVWLNFFASWCPPCNAEAENIVKLAGRYSDALHIIGIDVKELPEKARGFKEKHGITYPIALDQTGSVFKTLGLRGYSTHVFIDSLGSISCVSEGDLTLDQMDNEISVAIARRQATAKSNVPFASPSPAPSG